MKVNSMLATGCVLMSLVWMPSIQAAGPDVSHEGLDYQNQMVAKSATNKYRALREEKMKTCKEKRSWWGWHKNSCKNTDSDKRELRNSYENAKKTCKGANGMWDKEKGCHFRK